MIDPKEARDLLTRHENYCEANRGTWLAYREAFGDNFWKGVSGISQGHRSLASVAKYADAAGDGSPKRLLFEENHVKTWVFSFLDSLYHSGLRTTVTTGVLEDPDGCDPTAIAALLDDWLDSILVEEGTEQGFQMSLIYPECAFVIDTCDSKALVESVKFEVLAPWDAVWDRNAKSVKDMRYIGRIRYLNIEDVMQMEEWDVEREDLEPEHHGDALTGIRDMADLDGHQIRVLELFDLTDPYIDDESGATDPAGSFRIYILSVARGATADNGMKLVYDGAMPFTDLNGKGIPNIIPVILQPHADKPLQGVAPVATIYNQNAELNFARSVFATAARVDADRKLLVNGDVFDNEKLDKLSNGTDGEVIPVGQGKLDGAAKWLDNQPVSSTISEYHRMTTGSMEATAGTAPMTRGQPLKYASATEANHLNSYTETTLGRLRRRMDRVVIKVLRMVLRLMGESIKGKQDVYAAGEKHTVDKSWFDKRWRISLVDEASTPMAQQQRRAELVTIMPQLLELSDRIVKAKDPMSMALLDLLVTQYRLPESFRPRAILDNAPEPKPAPDAGPSPDAANTLPPDPADGGVLDQFLALPPEEQLAIMQDPARAQQLLEQLTPEEIAQVEAMTQQA